MILSLKEDKIAKGKFVNFSLNSLNFSYYKVARVIFRNEIIIIDYYRQKTKNLRYEILLSSSNDNKFYFHSSRGSIQL